MTVAEVTETTDSLAQVIKWIGEDRNQLAELYLMLFSAYLLKQLSQQEQEVRPEVTEQCLSTMKRIAVQFTLELNRFNVDMSEVYMPKPLKGFVLFVTG